MNVKTLTAVVVGATAIGLSISVAPANAATFLNNAVQADNIFPNINTVAEALGTKTIDLDGEIFNSAGLGANALVTSTNITITNIIPGAFASDPFNGLRFLDANGTIDDIIGVTLASSTFPGFDISRVTFDPDRIFVNFTGLPVTPVGATISLDVQFAGATPIPTPALLPGLIGLGAAALRKRQAEQPTEEA
jgi:hypothetical protein